MTLKLTILGCGSSGGVPRIGNHWGACDPENPRNRRRRCSLLVERETVNGTTTVLVDTTPDMRLQLIDAGVSWLDGVLYTHEHADHIHGIDDLRMVVMNGRRHVDVYFDERTGDVVTQRFNYCFDAPEDSPYPPILNAYRIAPLEPVTITGAGGNVTALPYEQEHGSINSLGFRFGSIAYSSDLNDISDASLECLQDLDVWIIDALRYRPHPTHLHVDKAIELVERVRPKRAILTNMHIDLDYETLKKELPDGIEPAYDGLMLTTGEEIRYPDTVQETA